MTFGFNYFNSSNSFNSKEVEHLRNLNYSNYSNLFQKKQVEVLSLESYTIRPSSDATVKPDETEHAKVELTN